jgi:hypothetical protein
VLVGIVAAVSLALVLVPVRATYLSAVGTDTVEYRTASCGSAVVAMLGRDPGLDGGSAEPFGGRNAETACEAGAGRRMTVALVLLLAAATAWGWSRKREVVR